MRNHGSGGRAGQGLVGASQATAGQMDERTVATAADGAYEA